MARGAAMVVLLVLAGFVVGSYAGVEPVWVAAAGAIVLCWGIVVAAVSQTEVVQHLEAQVPAGAGLWSLIGLALVAMVAANVLNNLPATLLLVPFSPTPG